MSAFTNFIQFIKDKKEEYSEAVGYAKYIGYGGLVGVLINSYQQRSAMIDAGTFIPTYHLFQYNSKFGPQNYMQNAQAGLIGMGIAALAVGGLMMHKAYQNYKDNQEQHARHNKHLQDVVKTIETVGFDASIDSVRSAPIYFQPIIAASHARVKALSHTDSPISKAHTVFEIAKAINSNSINSMSTCPERERIDQLSAYVNDDKVTKLFLNAVMTRLNLTDDVPAIVAHMTWNNMLCSYMKTGSDKTLHEGLGAITHELYNGYKNTKAAIEDIKTFVAAHPDMAATLDQNIESLKALKASMLTDHYIEPKKVEVPVYTSSQHVSLG